MIRSNLAILLAQRKLKITQVAQKTGISRTTLTALSNNSCQGIQFNTLDTLCLYLNITPNQLISFIPFSIDDIRVEIEFSKGTDFAFMLYLTITENLRTTACSFPGTIRLVVRNSSIEAIIGTISLWDSFFDISLPEDYESQNHLLLTLLAKMTLAFQNDLSEQVGAKIFDSVKKNISAYSSYIFSKEFFSTTIIWPLDEK